jgi:hypothetical protein
MAHRFACNPIHSPLTFKSSLIDHPLSSVKMQLIQHVRLHAHVIISDSKVTTLFLLHDQMEVVMQMQPVGWISTLPPPASHEFIHHTCSRGVPLI